MTITPKFKQKLKAEAHKLKPVILVGNAGVTPALIKETDRALTDHELIKVRIPVQDRDLRKQLFAEICDGTQSELVQMIGNIGVLYRKNEEEK